MIARIGFGLVGWIAIAAMAASPTLAQVQPLVEPLPAPLPSTPIQAPQRIKVPEGTEVAIRFEDTISSSSNTQGDRFSIVLDEPIELGDGVVIPAGYRGTGQVTNAEKRGFMGQAGMLNISIDYIRIGDTRVRLRGSQGKEGRGAMGWTVTLTVLFGPLGLLKRGKDVTIPRGQVITAYVDAPTELQLPLAPPPN